MPLAEKEEVGEEPSDIEEGGLDLTVALKPVSFYIADKKEMLQQCFCVIGEKKLQKMLPDILKVLEYTHVLTHSGQAGPKSFLVSVGSLNLQPYKLKHPLYFLNKGYINL